MPENPVRTTPHGSLCQTRLVRAGRDGATIHLATCKRAKGTIVVGWEWAEGRPDSEWITKGWLKPCRSCLPGVAKQQDEMRARLAAWEDANG